ncbi:MAG: glycoside hydrolase [Cytophagaceae bacterium]|nr:glycoside hydrolase [Cytophagaceae bacterium]MBL0327705.1 glycoside hydrolase [Cytophagaceae bacterium]
MKSFISKYWNHAYRLLLLSLIVLYPNLVSDGHSWKFISKYQIDLPMQYLIHGFDISRHNGDVDWGKINSKREDETRLHFVVIKATEGAEMVDVNFKTNWENARKHGFVRGAYHYFVPGVDARLQALNYILNVKHQKGDIYPVLDFEKNANGSHAKKQLASGLKTWLDIVEKHLGVKPIIYTNTPVYKEYIKSELAEYPLWISDYVSKDIGFVDSPNLILWQHSETGRLPGINENVDFNVFLGTPHKFEKYRINI